MKRLSKQQRELVAAYLLDRADQYDTNSASWVGLADAAEAVVNGAVETAARNGELVGDDDLLRRIRKLARLGRI